MRQKQALGVMLGGDSVFLTGPPGAGKTYVLNDFVHRAEKRGRKVAVTASTGIAATHIGGATIHSWSGLGIRDQLNAYDIDWLKKNDRLKKRYNGTDVLVIDEVSMLHGARLDMVNEACKLLRNSDAPFGGLQIVLVGDLFQLPPVNRESDLVDFAHTSAAWEELNPKICYITEQHRQQGDQLLDVLEAMRNGALEDWHTQTLMERLGKKPDENMAITRLYAHNIDVDSINQKHLANLGGNIRTFRMETKGGAAKIEQLKKSVLAPEVLELKTGAEVMFVANDFGSGFVNGSRGQVIGFDGDKPKVRLIGSGRTIYVEPHAWTLTEDGRVKAEVAQLPLRLAWAITIHKSQGMSLDSAEIDLGKSFTPGMGYVALSRVRSLDGVYLSGMNRMAMQLHPDIYDFDAELRSSSELLAATVEDALEEAAEPEPEVPERNEELLQKLKAWRMRRAIDDRVPAYIIAHDRTLEELVLQPPANQQQLLATKGFGPAKAEKYGPDILKITIDYAVAPEDVDPAREIATAEAAFERDQKARELLVDMDNPAMLEDGVPDPEFISDWQRYRAELSARYPRTGKRWTDEEDGHLLELFNSGASLGKVCEALGRPPGGVWGRLTSLLGSREPAVPGLDTPIPF